MQINRENNIKERPDVKVNSEDWITFSNDDLYVEATLNICFASIKRRENVDVMVVNQVVKRRVQDEYAWLYRVVRRRNNG